MGNIIRETARDSLDSPRQRALLPFGGSAGLTLSPSSRERSSSRDHPSSRSPLQSSFAPVSSHAPFRAVLHLPRFLPSRDLTRTRPPTTRRSKASLRSVRRLSQPLDGLLRVTGLRACSIPLPRPGLARSGASPFAQPPSLSEGAYPRAVRPPSTHRPKPVAIDDDPDFEASIRAKMRSPWLQLFTVTEARSPLRVCLLQVLRFLVVHPAYLDAPLLTFASALFACALRTKVRLQRLPRESRLIRLRTADLPEFLSHSLDSSEDVS